MTIAWNICESTYKAPISGAVVAAVGLDKLFPAPALVHWALAGVATDWYCNNYSTEGMDATSVAGCAAGAILGGAIASTVLGR